MSLQCILRACRKHIKTSSKRPILLCSLYTRWADSNEDRENKLVKRENELLRNEKELHKIEDEIERGMVLHKINDEIEKRKLAIHDDQVDLRMKQAEVQHSCTLLHVYCGFTIVVSCYVIGSK